MVSFLTVSQKTSISSIVFESTLSCGLAERVVVRMELRLAKLAGTAPASTYWFEPASI